VRGDQRPLPHAGADLAQLELVAAEARRRHVRPERGDHPRSLWRALEHLEGERHRNEGDTEHREHQARVARRPAPRGAHTISPRRAWAGRHPQKTGLLINILANISRD
jgi:hypothetical protein